MYEVATNDSFHANLDPTKIGWRANVAQSGGGELIDTGYHPTYLLLHLAAEEPVEVAAMLSSHRKKLNQLEDSARVLVRFASGKVGSIVTSWAYEPASRAERFSVVGEKGSLTATQSAINFKPLGQPVRRIELPGSVDTFAAEIAHFLDCLDNKQKPIQTEVDGIAALRVILAAYRSAREKRIVSVTED